MLTIIGPTAAELPPRSCRPPTRSSPRTNPTHGPPGPTDRAPHAPQQSRSPTPGARPPQPGPHPRAARTPPAASPPAQPAGPAAVRPTPVEPPARPAVSSFPSPPLNPSISPQAPCPGSLPSLPDRGCSAQGRTSHVCPSQSRVGQARKSYSHCSQGAGASAPFQLPRAHAPLPSKDEAFRLPQTRTSGGRVCRPARAVCLLAGRCLSLARDQSRTHCGPGRQAAWATPIGPPSGRTTCLRRTALEIDELSQRERGAERRSPLAASEGRKTRQEATRGMLSRRSRTDVAGPRHGDYSGARTGKRIQRAPAAV